MKAITLLGSTGSIGTQTLDIVSEHPDQFRVVGMAAGRNVAMLAQQIRQFRPEIVAIWDKDKLPELKAAIADLDPQPIVLAGEEGVIEVARYGDSEAVVTGIVGCAGLLPTIAAIEAGKDIALANKETLIAGGPVVLPLIEKYGYAPLESVRDMLGVSQELRENLCIAAHLAHVAYAGRLDDEGKVVPRYKITMASGLGEATCKRVNLGYLDHRSFDYEALRTDPDTLIVENAGRDLYQV